MKKNVKGITLIALIITIVVLLVLAMVTIREITGDGIIAKAREARFKAMMSEYNEQLGLYLTEKRLEQYVNGTVNIADINAGATELEPQKEMKEILGQDVKKGYENKIAIEMGELYYVPTDKEDYTVKNEIKWCFEIGIKVKGYASYEDFQYETAPVSNGSYEQKGSIYVNTPDLSGFSKAHTYYVSYGQDGKGAETIGGKIIEEAPEYWYDYEKQIWANVVTKGNGGVAYWVWIPRYAYKINADETVDVKFLSIDNVYIDAAGKKTKYTEATLAAEGYKLSEAFSWGNEGNKVPIAGYWVSKYEVSEAPTFNIEKTANGDIKITKINNSAGGPYKYYLDGQLKQENTSSLYTFENVEPFKTHEIKIEDSIGVVMTREVYVDAINTHSVPTATPDVSGFKNTHAYYVLYDATGQTETIGEEIQFNADGTPSNIPKEGWYNYGGKIWANIVTASEALTDVDKADITKCTKKIAYWVWIPRYEYKIIDSSKESDYMEGDTTLQAVSIYFIDTSTTSPREGYQIPDSFKWNETPIPGYWVSKYEVSE